MTPKLAEIRGRLAAATPGPWEWVEPHSVVHHPQEPEVAHATWNIAAIEGLFTARHANGDFIAAAPDDIAYLLRVAEAAEALANSTKGTMAVAADLAVLRAALEDETKP